MWPLSQVIPWPTSNHRQVYSFSIFCKILSVITKPTSMMHSKRSVQKKIEIKEEEEDDDSEMASQLVNLVKSQVIILYNRTFHHNLLIYFFTIIRPRCRILSKTVQILLLL
jgi:hypothetical protein